MSFGVTLITNRAGHGQEDFQQGGRSNTRMTKIASTIRSNYKSASCFCAEAKDNEKQTQRGRHCSDIEIGFLTVPKSMKRHRKIYEK
jgi:hypothetical protein